MAKLKDDAITAKDLEEFIGSNSDFAFEMRVLAELRGLGFECSHSGTYRDPITDKVRQYDVRAVTHRNNATLALAVECKNLRPNTPLLLSAVPRTESESFHDIIAWKSTVDLFPQWTRAVTGGESLYKPGEMVAKKTDQVGRESSGALVSNDEATFEKLNQAVNSCCDLVRFYVLSSSPPLFRAIVPLLVVPSGLLWQVEYDLDGRLKSMPHQVERASLFLNHTWPVELGVGRRIIYRLSHIDLATVDALPNIVDVFFGPDGLFTSVRDGR